MQLLHWYPYVMYQYFVAPQEPELARHELLQISCFYINNLYCADNLIE